MALITDYTSLVDNITSYGDRAGDPDYIAQIPTWIALAEASFNRKLKSRFMDTTTTLTTDADGYATLPTDFLRANSLNTVNGSISQPLGVIAQGSIAALFPINTGGIATNVAVYGDEIRIQTSALSSVVLNYAARFVGLTALTSTNFIIRLHPDLYLFAVMAHAAAWLKDWQEASTVGAQAQSIASDIDDMYSLELYNNAGMTLEGTSP